MTTRIPSRDEILQWISDNPTHTGKRDIARAFAALGARDAVLGPASDGGYWLIGLKRSRPVPMSFLKDVRWSTRHALSDTLASMAGLTFSLTDTLDDVDDIHDLARLSARQRHLS